MLLDQLMQRVRRENNELPARRIPLL